MLTITITTPISAEERAVLLALLNDSTHDSVDIPKAAETETKREEMAVQCEIPFRTRCPNRFPDYISDTSIYTKVNWRNYIGVKADILRQAIKETKPVSIKDNEKHHFYVHKTDATTVVLWMNEYIERNFAS